MDDRLFPGAGTPAPGAPAHMTAVADQHTAALRDLVQLVRDHRDAHDCPPGLPCPGPWALEVAAELRCFDRLALLLVAAAELDALGYGRPTADDAHWPTDLPGGA